MACASLQAFMERPIVIFVQKVLVVGVRTLFDDKRRALPRRQTTEIGETLLSDNHIQVVFCTRRVQFCEASRPGRLTSLVDVRGEWNDATDSSRIGLGRATGRGVHNRQLSVP